MNALEWLHLKINNKIKIILFIFTPFFISNADFHDIKNKKII